MKEFFQKEKMLNLNINSVYEMGFTIIELMITLVVLAIIISLAAPSFVSMIQNNRATGATNDLIASFQLARTEAIKRNGTVLLKKKNSAGTRNCPNADWACGHQIGVDVNGDSNLTGAEILRNVDAPHSSVTMISAPDSRPASLALSEISYNSSGGVAAITTFTIDSSVCETGVSRKVRNLRLNLSGASTLTTSPVVCP